MGLLKSTMFPLQQVLEGRDRQPVTKIINSKSFIFIAKVTSDAANETNPDFDNSGAPESFLMKNKKKFDKYKQSRSDVRVTLLY